MDDGGIPGARYAGFADRTAAFIIDGIIVSTLFFYLLEGVVYIGGFIGPLLFAGTAAAFDEPKMPLFFGSALAGFVLMVLLCWLYSAGITSSQYGGTFGKMIMGLKVVDPSGDTISFGRATVRFVAKIFSGLILFIGFFMIHFSPVKQGLHDRFAGTFVVYSRKGVTVSPEAGPDISRTPAEAEETKEEESRKKVRTAITWIVAIPVILILLIAGIAAVIAFSVSGMAGGATHTYVVAATAQQVDASTIIITYHGGQDAEKLISLSVSVNGSDPVAWASPAVGERKIVAGGTSGKDHVTVTGHFTNGAEQVILDTDL